MTKGIEADFIYEPIGFAPLSLYGAVAYNDAEYEDFIGSCYTGQTVALGCDQLGNNAQTFSGRTPPKAPKWGARFGGSLDFPISDTMNFEVTGDANYTSSYNYTDALRPDAIQDEFVKFNASAAVSGNDEMWKLSLIGRNLTNELVVTSANDMSYTTPLTGGSPDMNGVVAQPREIYIEAAFKF